MPNGAETLPVGAGHAWQFFDPPVAIGYNYELKPSVSGQKLTFGVADIMVTTKVGSGVYDLWLYDAFQSAYVDASKFTGHEVTITADPTANPSGAFDVLKFLSSLSAAPLLSARRKQRRRGQVNPASKHRAGSARDFDFHPRIQPRHFLVTIEHCEIALAKSAQHQAWGRDARAFDDIEVAPAPALVALKPGRGRGDFAPEQRGAMGRVKQRAIDEQGSVAFRIRRVHRNLLPRGTVKRLPHRTA